MIWLLAAAATGYALAPDNGTVIIQQPANSQPAQQQEQTVVIKTVCVTPEGEAVLCPTPIVEVKDANTNSKSK